MELKLRVIHMNQLLLILHLGGSLVVVMKMLNLFLPMCVPYYLLTERIVLLIPELITWETLLKPQLFTTSQIQKMKEFLLIPS